MFALSDLEADLAIESTRPENTQRKAGDDGSQRRKEEGHPHRAGPLEIIGSGEVHIGDPPEQNDAISDDQS